MKGTPTLANTFYSATRKEEMNDLTLAYTIEQMKAVEMRLKDTNTPVTEPAHRDNDKERKEKVCYHCSELGHIKFYCDDWLANTEGGRRHGKKDSSRNRDRSNDTRTSS